MSAQVAVSSKLYFVTFTVSPFIVYPRWCSSFSRPPCTGCSSQCCRKGWSLVLVLSSSPPRSAASRPLARSTWKLHCFKTFKRWQSENQWQPLKVILFQNFQAMTTTESYIVSKLSSNDNYWKLHCFKTFKRWQFNPTISGNHCCWKVCKFILFRKWKSLLNWNLKWWNHLTSWGKYKASVKEIMKLWNKWWWNFVSIFLLDF